MSNHQKSKSHCHWRLVSLGVEPHLGLMTRYLLLFDSYGLVFVGRPLWREDGSVFCICCWSWPAQSFSGPSSLGLAAIFYCLRFETSFFVASCDSQGHGGGIRPLLHTGSKIMLGDARNIPARNNKKTVLRNPFLSNESVNMPTTIGVLLDTVFCIRSVSSGYEEELVENRQSSSGVPSEQLVERWALQRRLRRWRCEFRCGVLTSRVGLCKGGWEDGAVSSGVEC
jgi:hypothetical protein